MADKKQLIMEDKTKDDLQTGKRIKKLLPLMLFSSDAAVSS